MSAVFAAGFFTGSFLPLGSGEVTTAPVTPEVPTSEATTDTVADGVEPPPATTAPPPAATPAAAAGLFFYPYTPGDYGSGPCAPAERTDEAVLNFAEAPGLCIDVTAAHTAVFDTSAGTVRVALDAARTPGTVNNFVNLARFGYYDATLIHRSDPSIGILQGGSPHTDNASDPGPGYVVWDEGSGFSYRPGQLAMARTSGPNSADAQFFFTVTEAAALLDGDGTYVVFGEVLEGLDVLVDILGSHLAETGNDFGGAPDPPVVVNSITIETQNGAPPAATPAGAAGLFFYPYTPGDYGSGPCAPAERTDEAVLNFAEAPGLCIDVTAAHTAVFDTSAGTVRVALDAARTPGTVNNFVNLARFGYYDATLIHRSDPSIGILQGGSPHTNNASDPGPGYQVRDEGSGFTYRPGQLAMARTSGPNSADAQFFFTVTEAAALLDGQGTYVVFGEVLEGLDVLVDILGSHLAETGNDFGGAPDPPVVVNSITIETQNGAPPAAPAATSLAYSPYTPGDYGSGPCAPAERTDEAVLNFAEAPGLCIDVTAAHTAVFDTSAGTVRVALDAARTPGTVNNFVNLARFGYYDATLIHRSDPSIGILQGGSPHTGDASDPGPGYVVWDEGSGFSYRPGQLVMARTSGPDSADAQFFFTVTEAAALLDGDGTYVVFGEVLEGLDVLVDILGSHLAETGNDFGGAPDPPVVVNSITIETQDDATPAAPAATSRAYSPYTPGDYGSGPCAPAERTDEAVLNFAEAPGLCIDVTAAHTAVFDTSAGTVRVALDAARTPGTVNNFVNLARFGYYDATLIHRSDPSIGTLQGGSPHTNDASDPGPGYQVRDEGSGFTYRPGQLAMARTSGPDSADAQFFFTVTEATALLDGDGTYVVFGEVLEGLDVLVDILGSHLAETGNDLGGAPDPPVVVNSITIETQNGAPPAAVEGGEQPPDENGEPGQGTS